MSWVVLSGGLVVNDSGDVETFDLDFMEDDFMDQNTLDEAMDTLERLLRYGDPLLVTYIHAIDRWITDHQYLKDS